MVHLPNPFSKRNVELEFAGEVVDADLSTAFTPGDKVAGFVEPDIHITKCRGTLAQYITVKPKEITKRPDFITINEASGVVGVASTAYQALFEVAKLRQEPSQFRFISGRSTSVDMYAIQIVKSYGLKMAASTSGRNVKLVEKLGAEVRTSYSSVVVQLLIVDKIVDEPAVLEGFWDYHIVPYLLVSRAWVARTRKYCFEHIEFRSLDVLEDWRARIAPDPTGVLQHTRMLGFLNIHTLKGFEEHMHAFTRAKHTKIMGPCGSFSSRSATDCLAPMDSSLTRLELCSSETTSHITLLAGLPSRRASLVSPLKR